MKIYKSMPFCPFCSQYNTYFGDVLFTCSDCNYDFWFDECINEINLMTMVSFVFDGFVYNDITVSEALRIAKLRSFQ